MKKTSALLALVLGTGLSLSPGLAVAQHHDDHGGDHGDYHGGQHYVRHSDWHNGGHIDHNDWNRGTPVDYRHYHLHAPPRGYQWREVDGNYVLAAVATGVISSVIIASAQH
jgi:Ni/Co efflux regulator RcnB